MRASTDPHLAGDVIVTVGPGRRSPAYPCALGVAVRERGHRDDAGVVLGEAHTALTPLFGTAAACRLTGLSRATVYRRRDPPRPARPRTPRRPPPSTLSDNERRDILALLNSPEYADLAPAQVWARELDDGRWWCSESTMYRILRAAGQNGERRRQATHPARTKPELVACAPNQVWSWDITKLRGPVKGVWYHLYTVLDIYSRYVVAHLVAAVEDGELAEALIADAAARERVDRDQLTIHADRGAAMTCKTVAQLMSDLKITRSHSRPKTSNDNPYIEASFKTLKYDPSFPAQFGSLQHARQHCEAFYTYYNHEHRHSGIGLHTPASVHHGTAQIVRAQRQRTLDTAWAAHPERFTRRPRPPRLPERAWINKPDTADPHRPARCVRPADHNMTTHPAGAETGFWDDHGRPAPWPDDIDDWTPETRETRNPETGQPPF